MTIDEAIRHIGLLADGKEEKLETHEYLQIIEWLKMVKKDTGYPPEISKSAYELGYERGYSDGSRKTV